RQDLLLPYLADAIDADERAELESHLATGCPRCAGALAEAEAILARLSLALDPIAPSPQARERLLQRITPPAPPVTETPQAPAPPLPPPIAPVTTIQHTQHPSAP